MALYSHTVCPRNQELPMQTQYYHQEFFIISLDPDPIFFLIQSFLDARILFFQLGWCRPISTWVQNSGLARGGKQTQFIVQTASLSF